jgi:hypothetical protein
MASATSTFQKRLDNLIETIKTPSQLDQALLKLRELKSSLYAKIINDLKPEDPPLVFNFIPEGVDFSRIHTFVGSVTIPLGVNEDGEVVPMPLLEGISEDEDGVQILDQTHWFYFAKLMEKIHVEPKDYLPCDPEKDFMFCSVSVNVFFAKPRIDSVPLNKDIFILDDKGDSAKYHFKSSSKLSNVLRGYPFYIIPSFFLTELQMKVLELV